MRRARIALLALFCPTSACVALSHSPRFRFTVAGAPDAADVDVVAGGFRLDLRRDPAEAGTYRGRFEKPRFYGSWGAPLQVVSAAGTAVVSAGPNEPYLRVRAPGMCTEVRHFEGRVRATTTLLYVAEWWFWPALIVDAIAAGPRARTFSPRTFDLEPAPCDDRENVLRDWTELHITSTLPADVLGTIDKVSTYGTYVTETVTTFRILGTTPLTLLVPSGRTAEFQVGGRDVTIPSLGGAWDVDVDFADRRTRLAPAARSGVLDSLIPVAP